MTLAKLMVSLDDKTEAKMRTEVKRLYLGKNGGISIFFEQLIKAYFQEKREKRRAH